MAKEELDAMVAEEEKRLGIGSEEFMKRHNEIIEEVDQIKEREEEKRKMVAAVSSKIIVAMTKSGKTPVEIAEKARVPVNAVYRMRKGYLIRMDKFGRICDALGVAVEDVLDFSRLEQKGNHGKS